jgi:hypothetical protein
MGDQKNPFGGGLAGGSMGGSPTPAGGATSPTALPYGPPNVPGSPGSIWGPGATFIQPGAGQTGQQFPEIIGAGGQASIFGPQGWTAAGQNATVPTGGPLPNFPGATGVNTMPGQPLMPNVSNAIDPMAQPRSYPNTSPFETQPLLASLNAARGGGLTNQEVQNSMIQWLGNMPKQDYTFSQAPGYAKPQTPINYVPAQQALQLEQSLEKGQPTGQGISSILGNWSQGLSRMPATGVTVPNTSGSAAKK